ncbi:RNA polymerase sigma-70 factor, ECF subfamily [Evansella caseinilytica]|uniref:RNA polymerase sigma-70 factor, ECF subfamily n=1 Tax=Evansella caseinilytica TaxID=1503961 RepID=A0A1H3IS12_9BACI|nr:sigma-70 family RNA polymerase sigma factor [Evansella caseinilytica]SDY30502.1 RNA polymerase sigma-70 factor, ECF subfamily [Evansella caseinilytica]
MHLKSDLAGRKTRADAEKNVNDEKQLEQLYAKLQKYCQFLSRNKWDSEDLVQEAFYKAIKHYRDKTELTAPLLKRIAHNTWLDRLRKYNKETLSAEPAAADTEAARLGKESEIIDELVSKLTPKQLVIFTLREAFQFKMKEVAGLMGMSETAVKAVIYRAKARIEKMSNSEAAPVVAEFWTEQLKEELTAAVRHAVRIQDPTVLLKLLPDIFTSVRGPKVKTAATPKLLSASKHARFTSSPSGSLSLAA